MCNRKKMTGRNVNPGLTEPNKNTSIAIRQTGLELHSPAFRGRLIHMYEREPMWCVGLELLQARYGLRSCAPMSK